MTVSGETTPRRTQAERSAAMRARLLEATIECLVELGYPGTSSPEVCRRAGVSRGAQLHHFPTKAALVTAAVEHLFVRRHGEVRALVEAGHVADDLEPLFERLWAIYSGPAFAAWMELVVAARTDPELRAQVAAFERQFVAEVEETFRRLFGLGADVDVAPQTRLVLAVMDGLALERVLEPAEALPRRVLALFRGLIEPWRRAGQACGDEEGP